MLYKGQKFEATGKKHTHHKRNGLRVELYEWGAKCLTCGKPFTFWHKSAPGERLHYPSRRCPEHATRGASKQPAIDQKTGRNWITQTKRGVRYWRGRETKEHGGLTLYEWRFRCFPDRCPQPFAAHSFFNPGKNRIVRPWPKAKKPEIDIFS